jgi:hypothetical protein
MTYFHRKFNRLRAYFSGGTTYYITSNVIRKPEGFKARDQYFDNMFKLRCHQFDKQGVRFMGYRSNPRYKTRYDK